MTNLHEDIMTSIAKDAAVAFSFDTTGSMNPCIADVRAKLKELASDMLGNIPNLKIAVIAHGDYCDGSNAVKFIDFTENLDDISKFLSTVPNTGGGDAPECYELALHTASNLSWPQGGGTLVLIGDDEPHEPDYALNTKHLDWRIELKSLMSKKVRVVPLQCLRQSHPGLEFWGMVSNQCETPLLYLDTFSESSSALGAIAAASSGTESLLRYTDNLTSTGRMNDTVYSNFVGLTSYASTRDVDLINEKPAKPVV